MTVGVEERDEGHGHAGEDGGESAPFMSTSWRSAVDGAGQGLVPRGDNDLVEVDVGWAGDSEGDAVGHVVGREGVDPLVHLGRAGRSPRKRTTENSVSTIPGSTSVMRMGRPSSSRRSTCVKARTPNLAAL